MSRLVRILVSGNWTELYPVVCQIALPKPTSDHRSSFLDSNSVCVCISFFFNVVAWAGFQLALKLKMWKGKIKEWAKDNFGDVGLPK